MGITREQLVVVSKIFPNMTVKEFLALTEREESGNDAIAINKKNESKLHAVKKDNTGIYIDGFKVNGVQGFQVEKPMDTDDMNIIFKVAVKDFKFIAGGN
ncbi:MAG: hypothetical protein RSC84_02690 [Peptostreptococcaceae bacterium]